MVESLLGKKNMPPKEITYSETKDLWLGKKIPPGFGTKVTTTPITETRYPKETLSPSTKTQALADPVTRTLLIFKVSKHEIQEEVIPLSEYKFDHSKLAVVKRTPKHKRILIGGAEKPLIEGYEESTLWDISGPYVSCVGVETSAMIVGMALVGQLSSEAMEKEILYLKQLVTQTQSEMTESIK